MHLYKFLSEMYYRPKKNCRKQKMEISFTEKGIDSDA